MTARIEPSHERIDGMLRKLLGVVGGFIAFFVIGTAGFFLLRVCWHDYALVEKEMKFTLAMLLSRLGISVLCSVGAGWVAMLFAKGDTTTSWWLGVLMLLLFIPIHYGLWDKFPVWYHLVFLMTLAPIIGFSGRLGRRTG
jgi:hypothetical protein